MRWHLLVVFSLVACAKGADQPVTSKGLFSLWTATNGSALDLRTGTFGVNDYAIPFGPNDVCTCTVAITGSQSPYVINVQTGCTHGGSGSLNCGAYEQTYNVAVQSNTLTLCPVAGGACSTYY